MANRLNQQSPQLRLKDSIKREMSRINRDTLPLNCYAEVTKSLKDTVHLSQSSVYAFSLLLKDLEYYSCCWEDDFSVADIIQYQDNQYYKSSENECKTYDEYINSLTEEQNIIYYFNDYYDLSNEIYYKKRFGSNLDKLPNEVECCVRHLYLSLSLYNGEIEKINNQKKSEINEGEKRLKKLLKSIQQYRKIINKYSAFWNKMVEDLIFLYNKYSETHPIEGIIHSSVVLYSLIKENDIRTNISKIIFDLYKKHINVLNFEALNALFLCSLSVKFIIAKEIGTTREFVIDKIIPNDKLKQIFFTPYNENS
jgi:hypothetical protein